ncbi:mitochondrial 54S ribosomal protein YmL6 [Aspergillus nidulans FGSC A4]|uniref:Large ribosomal subunit protein uL4m n=1 Tax=Emericella nidulans (strain FGSC A4 / ATCC 38163 / CBS 112.46 / NRRL 194 / M139) TaxID=227321 RepID=C8V2I4_EMENI|nr:mitochondrial 54S ribosomal protein YmL6 [Aspergillus nidulans FGSC A4]CBF71574.1 TPA: 50S ribosomal protein L4 (AFU_orthologue; AFUA_5G12800) [Aspergillus nidulans FGSC A4]
MAGSSAFGTFRWLSRSSRGLLSGTEATTQRCLSRSLATITEAPAVNVPPSREELLAKWAPKPVLATTYSFPTMEPVQFVEYARNHLMMPLRKDILHRAVVYEGDMTRQGTASTKWRGDVHGSNRKLYAQKGTGRARVGDKKSPIRRGGGVAFGPHPRDFSTELPRKIYDQAWRIALSYRYRRGQLIIIDNEIGIPEDATPYFIKEIFKFNRWGREFGRSTLITDRVHEELFETVRSVGEDAKILDRGDVDVKDLLETGRLIVEKRALDRILKEHSRDLNNKPAKATY